MRELRQTMSAREYIEDLLDEYEKHMDSGLYYRAMSKLDVAINVLEASKSWVETNKLDAQGNPMRC